MSTNVYRTSFGDARFERAEDEPLPAFVTEHQTFEEPAAPEPGSFDGEETGETPEPEPAPKVDPEIYRNPFPSDHFISKWVEYVGRITDAAPEYAEAHALALLGLAGAKARLPVGQYAIDERGLAPFLYQLHVGPSTSSRKTHALAIARRIAERLDGDSTMAEQTSPEGLLQQLGDRDGRGSLWYADEIGHTLFQRMKGNTWMTPLRGMLLSFYNVNKYKHKLKTKLTKSGTKIQDEIHVMEANLGLVGTGTPDLPESMQASDLSDGFLPRFAVVWPKTFPPRKGLSVMDAETGTIGDNLAGWLRLVRELCERPGFDVRVEPEALSVIEKIGSAMDAYAQQHTNPLLKPMYQRMGAMAAKAALLSALGRSSNFEPYGMSFRDGERWTFVRGDEIDNDMVFRAPSVTVTVADAKAAKTIILRWAGGAERFVENIGGSDVMRLCRKAETVLKGLNGQAYRSKVSKALNVDKFTLDRVRDTLLDRGRINYEMAHTGARKKTEIWTLVD